MADAAQRDELTDEIAGHVIGSGYYSTSIAIDEAQEIADILLAAGWVKDEALLEWLFSINYPFDTSFPKNLPPVDHRRLAALWNERDGWDISDEDAYLAVCHEAGVEPEAARG